MGSGRSRGNVPRPSSNCDDKMTQSDRTGQVSIRSVASERDIQDDKKREVGPGSLERKRSDSSRRKGRDLRMYKKQEAQEEQKPGQYCSHGLRLSRDDWPGRERWMAKISIL